MRNLKTRGTKRPSVADRSAKTRRAGFLTVVIAIALVAALSVGGTFAYLTAKTESVVNEMEPAEVSCVVVDDGNDGKDIYINNTGNVDAYIRAAITVNWAQVDSSGNVLSIYGTPPVAGTDYNLSLNSSATGWGAVSTDGFYYHATKVAPDDDNDDTEILISSCTQLRAGPSGYVLMVDVAASAIQALPAEAVTTTWGVTMTGGKISKA